jgi:hypothetical protein
MNVQEYNVSTCSGQIICKKRKKERKKSQIYERWKDFTASKWNTVIGYKYISFWTLPS